MAPKFVFEMLRVLEKVISNAQGKGYGSFSVDSEVASVSRLLDNKQAQVCVDIGGNVGNYTQALIKRYPEAKVHIFEPSTTNIEILTKRFSDRKQVRVLPFAVSKESGSGVLYSDIPGSGLGSLSKRNLDHIGIEFECHETVNTIRFEEYWNTEMNRCEIDVLKLDIEGHEFDALQGCGEALKSTRVVQFEFGGCNIDTRTYFRDFWTLFDNLGFEIYRIAPIGEMQIFRYKERDEIFSTTNYLALNTAII